MDALRKKIENIKKRSLLLFALTKSGKSHSHSIPFSSSALLVTIVPAIATVAKLTFSLSLSLANNFHYKIAHTDIKILEVIKFFFYDT
jgi:hypothetical protein